MYTSVRKYRMDPEQVEELMQRVDKEFAPRIEEAPGFAGYQVVDCGDGTVYTVSTFADRDGAERSVEMAAEYVRDELSGIDIERLEADQGEVGVSRAASQLLEGAHA